MHEIIWTRSEADWERDKKLTQHLGTVHHYPCIQQQALVNIPTATAIQHFIITSKFALTCLKNHKVWWDLFCQKKAYVWCFGASLAKEIAKHRTPNLVVECKNGKELAYYLSKKLKRDATIAFLSAEQPAFDITGCLQQKGFQHAKHIPLYQTLNPIPEPFPFKKGTHYKIAFASPSAAKNFFEKNEIDPSKVKIYSIGETTKKSIPVIYSVKKPDVQSIESLIYSMKISE